MLRGSSCLYIRSEMKSVKTHIASELKVSLLAVLLLLLSSAQLLAQAKFYATAPKSVPVNQSFQLTYTLENGNGGNLKLSPLNDFQLIGGPNTSSNMQWVNGNVTQSISYTYILRPKKEGTFKIGKASIQVSGVTMESNELSIDVTQAVAQQPQRQRQRNPFDPFDDPFFNQNNDEQEDQPQVSSENLEKQLKDDVFIKLSVNKSSVYKGEMLTATYKLYFRQNLAGFNVTKAPAFDGFWSQEVDLDPKRRPATETINGKQYNTIEILKYNLYPQRAGKLSIAPTEVSTVAQVAVRKRSHNFFDDFFNAGQVQQVQLHLKTNAESINVKELPENGRPDDFDGAVGKFGFEANLSSRETKTDEPITYTVKISGTGNLKFIEPPKVKLPAQFEMYDPKTKENISNGAGGLSGSKQYDYLIIPRQPGEYKIDGQQFSYFDPSIEKYYTIHSPEFTVKVTGEPSKNANTNIAAANNKEDVSLIGQDINYIKTKMPVFKKSNSLFDSAGYTALYISPFFMLLGLVVLKKRNETLAADLVGAKRRRALKLAKKRLTAASKLLAQQDKKAFYNEISRALWGYLGDKLNIDMASLSKDNVAGKLLDKGVKMETIDRLKNLLSTCDLALYSPVGEGSEMKHNFDIAMNLMADFEDEIKDRKPQPEVPRYMSLLLVLLTTCLFTFSAFAQSPEQLYTTANGFYKAGQFEQAATTYEKLLMQDYRTSEVYYNLGNCYYKLNKLGPCILNYERALKLAPDDEDISHNLKIAELKTIDKIQPVPQLGIITHWHQFTTSQSAKGWGIIALIFIWLSLISFAVYLFVGFRLFTVSAGTILLLFSFAFLSLAFQQNHRVLNSNEAVLMVTNSYVKSAPDDNGNNVFLLHEGTKFRLLDKVGEWHKIKLADGKIGWLENNSFARI